LKSIAIVARVGERHRRGVLARGQEFTVFKTRRAAIASARKADPSTAPAENGDALEHRPAPR
jgi:hypothetical protein